jgi:hypothetical protein
MENNKLIFEQENLLKEKHINASIGGNTCSSFFDDSCEILSKCHLRCDNCTNQNKFQRRSFVEEDSFKFMDYVINESEIDLMDAEIIRKLEDGTPVPKIAEEIPKFCSDYRKSTEGLCRVFQFSYTYFKNCGPTFIIEQACERNLNHTTEKGQSKVHQPFTYDEILSSTSFNYFFAEYCSRAQESLAKCQFNDLDLKFCSKIINIMEKCYKMVPRFDAFSKEEFAKMLDSAEFYNKYLNESKALYLEYAGSDEDFELFAAIATITTTTTIRSVTEEPWWKV